MKELKKKFLPKENLCPIRTYCNNWEQHTYNVKSFPKLHEHFTERKRLMKIKRNNWKIII